MDDRSFTTAFRVDRTPEEVFAAVNNVRAWWSEDIQGDTAQAGSIFKYRFRDIHRSTIKVQESVPGKKVVWYVLDHYFNFTKDAAEWKGTRIVFDIAAKDGLTELRVTHDGLTPKDECYDVCADGWTTYVNGSLRSLIETGQGQPNEGAPMNDSERALAS